MIDIDEGRRLLAAATPGAVYVQHDPAHDTIPHRESGLARIDSEAHRNCKFPHWPIARLCEWHEANAIAWLYNNAPALLAELEAARRDAGRYRWLRERPQMMAQLGRAEHTIRLDAAIDAAIDAATAPVREPTDAEVKRAIYRAGRRSKP